MGSIVCLAHEDQKNRDRETDVTTESLKFKPSWSEGRETDAEESGETGAVTEGLKQ